MIHSSNETTAPPRGDNLMQASNDMKSAPRGGNIIAKFTRWHGMRVVRDRTTIYHCNPIYFDMMKMAGTTVPVTTLKEKEWR